MPAVHYCYGRTNGRTDGATRCDSDTARDARDVLNDARCITRDALH